MSRERGSAVDRKARKGRGRGPALTCALASAAGMCVGTAQGQEASAPAYVQLEDVVVVGTRLQRPAEAGEGHAPIKVFRADDIARLGVTNVADVLDYLPQQSFSSNEQVQPSGARIVQLRGLAVGNTLVLINGRRAPTSALLGALNAYNMNTIPISAVERIEVLSDAASAVYGADAVGGVVNVVLKSRVEAPAVDLYYGASQGGGDEKRGSVVYGMEGDRYRFALTADYFERDFLMGSERDLFNNQDYTRFGGTDFRFVGSRLTNISSTSPATNLPGLSAPVATVPVGSTGVGLTPADFASTAGQVNRTSTGAFRSVVPESERTSATALGDFAITADLRLFGEFLYSKQEDARRLPPSTLANATVAAGNPYNPFGVPVRVSHVFSDFGPQVGLSESELFRGVLGMRGKLGGSWDWEVSVLDTSEDGEASTENAINLTAARAALASTNPATALNLFSDGIFDAALLETLRAPVIVDRFSSDALQTTAFVRGSLFDLPAGSLDVVIGAEQRNEEIRLEVATAALSIVPDRDVYAGFVEARVPLVSNKMDVPAIDRLTVTLAARYDDYSDFGSTTNPQFGLEYGIVPSVLLRASYGESFRAPSLFEVNQTPIVLPNLPTVDPRRNNQVTPVQYTLGGNAQLQPEESTTLSTGLVFTPNVSFQPRIAVTYWEIEQDSRLQRLDAPALLANEAFFPNLVVRADPTPADVAAGLPGQLVSLDLRNINAGSLDTNGFDLEFTADFQTDAGTFRPSLSGTRVTRFKAADLPNAPIVDRLGRANVNGSIPKWRGSGSLAWELAGFGLTPTIRYISSYDDVNSANLLTGGRVDSQVLVDLQASLNFETAFGRHAWSQGLGVRLGVTNLLDEEAPFSQVGGQNGFDPSQGEVRGRFSYLMLTKSF